MALGYTALVLSAALSAAKPEPQEEIEATAKFLLESADIHLDFAAAGTCNEPDRKRRLRWLRISHGKVVAEFERITGSTVDQPITIMEGDACSYERDFIRNLAQAADSLRFVKRYLRTLR